MTTREKEAVWMDNTKSLSYLLTHAVAAVAILLAGLLLTAALLTTGGCVFQTAFALEEKTTDIEVTGSVVSDPSKTPLPPIVPPTEPARPVSPVSPVAPISQTPEQEDSLTDALSQVLPLQHLAQSLVSEISRMVDDHAARELLVLPDAQEPTTRPLVSEQQESWAVSNLACALVGMLLSFVVLLLGAKTQETRRAQTGDKQKGDELTGEPTKTMDPARKTALLWMVAMLVSATLGAVLFVLTEDITTPLIVFDHWTLVQVIFLVLVTGSAYVSVFVRKNKETFKKGGQT
jgi:hypothetical protein